MVKPVVQSMLISPLNLLLGVIFGVILGATAHAAEFDVSLGVASHNLDYSTGNSALDDSEITDEGLSFGISFRNQYGENGRHWFGAGVDVDDLAGETLIGYRALDYQYQVFSWLRTGGFFGAASLDSGLPQNGYYLGLQFSSHELFDRFDLSLTYKVGDGLARDRLLDDDPQPDDPDRARPDIFLDVQSIGFNLHYRF